MVLLSLLVLWGLLMLWYTSPSYPLLFSVDTANTASPALAKRCVLDCLARSCGGVVQSVEQGWTPTNDIESVVVQIRAQMVVGKARIDFDATSVTQVSCIPPCSETLLHAATADLFCGAIHRASPCHEQHITMCPIGVGDIRLQPQLLLSPLRTKLADRMGMMYSQTVPTPSISSGSALRWIRDLSMSNSPRPRGNTARAHDE